ncbi:MAG: hypothetical protein JRF30_12745 [Deltaproteobacteria bacterium]|nr:hypothetical protein [Deltaproteobacteria bacterium]
MQGKGKPIRLSEHARQQLRFRGATEQEVIEAIRTETWETAELGRLKNYYDTKQVRPIFVEEHDEVIVVTVYVYYF